MKTKQDKTKNFDFRSIKSFADACKHLNLKPENCLPDVSKLPEYMQKSVVAHAKLIIIYKAINNGWQPDWNKTNQYKYYPYFWVLSSGFGFDNSFYLYVSTNTYSSSRLCTDSSEKALYIAEQFEDIYRDFFLYEK